MYASVRTIQNVSRSNNVVRSNWRHTCHAIRSNRRYLLRRVRAVQHYTHIPIGARTVYVAHAVFSCCNPAKTGICHTFSRIALHSEQRQKGIVCAAHYTFATCFRRSVNNSNIFSKFKVS